jgi:hypothetical protein
MKSLQHPELIWINRQKTNKCDVADKNNAIETGIVELDILRYILGRLPCN